MASNAMAAANILNYVPELWSKSVKADVEHALVIASHVDRQYQADLTVGDRIHVPNVANLTANAVNTEQDITLNDAIQNEDIIIINQWYEAAVGIQDMHLAQITPVSLQTLSKKSGYAIAKQIDTYLAGLFNEFSQTVGTEGSAIKDDVLLQAKEYLDLADAPFEGRVLIIDPESLTDLLKIDKFVRMDYVPGGAVQNGQVGRIYGCDVFVTNNLEAINTSYHGAAMMQKEAIALIMQQEPKTVTWHWDERHTHVIQCTAIWGALEMRDTFGVWIKTRS